MTKIKVKMITGILNIFIASTLLNGCGGNGMNGFHSDTDGTNKNLEHKDRLCPICESGYQYLYTLSDEKNSIVLFCDECESVWLDPQDIGWDGVSSNEKLKEKFNVTDTKDLFEESHKKAHYAGWSTMEEIKKSKWIGFAENNKPSIYAITYDLNTEQKYPFSYLH